MRWNVDFFQQEKCLVLAGSGTNSKQKYQSPYGKAAVNACRKTVRLKQATWVLLAKIAFLQPLKAAGEQTSQVFNSPSSKLSENTFRVKVVPRMQHSNTFSQLSVCFRTTRTMAGIPCLHVGPSIGLQSYSNPASNNWARWSIHFERNFVWKSRFSCRKVRWWLSKGRIFHATHTQKVLPVLRPPAFPDWRENLLSRWWVFGNSVSEYQLVLFDNDRCTECKQSPF